MFFSKTLDLKRNCLLLFLAERNNSQGSIRMLFDVLSHKLDNTPCFKNVIISR